MCAVDSNHKIIASFFSVKFDENFATFSENTRSIGVESIDTIIES